MRYLGPLTAGSVAILLWLSGSGHLLAAHEARGESVAISSTIDAGGLVQTSASVKIVGFLGQTGALASNSTGTLVVRSGPVGMVVFPTGFSVDAEAKEISEAGAEPAQSTKTQLLGHAVNDDGTQDALLAGSVAWSPAAAGSALSSVSADGIATAGAVYADTIATFSGAYSGIVAMNSLTVRNVLGDNYGRLAGDTFDDAWEVNKGITDGLKPDELSNGMPNWLLYSMDLNPNSAGGNLVKATPDQDGYLTITYTRNPLAKNCEFTVEEAAEIKDGFTPLANPVSATHTQVNGTLSVTTRGSLPMNAVPKQFLRVRVQRTP